MEGFGLASFQASTSNSQLCLLDLDDETKTKISCSAETQTESDYFSRNNNNKNNNNNNNNGENNNNGGRDEGKDGTNDFDHSVVNSQDDRHQVVKDEITSVGSTPVDQNAVLSEGGNGEKSVIEPLNTTTTTATPSRRTTIMEAAISPSWDALPTADLTPTDEAARSSENAAAAVFVVPATPPIEATDEGRVKAATLISVSDLTSSPSFLRARSQNCIELTSSCRQMFEDI